MFYLPKTESDHLAIPKERGGTMDERLERLSDKVRMGIPIGLREAMEVIVYQEDLREERAKRGIFAKIWAKMKG